MALSEKTNGEICFAIPATLAQGHGSYSKYGPCFSAATTAFSCSTVTITNIMGLDGPARDPLAEGGMGLHPLADGGIGGEAEWCGWRTLSGGIKSGHFHQVERMGHEHQALLHL